MSSPTISMNKFEASLDGKHFTWNLPWASISLQIFKDQVVIITLDLFLASGRGTPISKRSSRWHTLSNNSTNLFVFMVLNISMAFSSWLLFCQILPLICNSFPITCWTSITLAWTLQPKSLYENREIIWGNHYWFSSLVLSCHVMSHIG